MIRFETRGAFAFVTLDAQATRNALSDVMVAGLNDALAIAGSRPETRALVIRGAGGTFCAGGDFSRFRELMASASPPEGPDPIAVFNRGFGAMLERLQACPVATIAVVEGAAMGGGVGLAAACGSPHPGPLPEGEGGRTFEARRAHRFTACPASRACTCR